MQNLTESQTQVYINGGVTPQHRNDNLSMLTSQFFKSGKSDAQVLAILCGMGVPQPWALKAIQEYNALNTMGGCGCGECAHEDNQKNETKMQFTLTELYDKVTKTLAKLQEMKEADKGRVSYSSANAIKVLENTLPHFPAFLKNADLDTISEELKIQLHLH